MISIREIADDNTSISSTRWAFASLIKFDIVIVLITLGAYLTGHFIGKPFDSSLFSGVATLLGVPTGLITASKILQGFETKKDKPDCSGKREETVITE